MEQLNSDGSWWWEMMINANKNDSIIAVFVTISIVIFAILWYKYSLSSSSPPLPPGPISLPIVGYLPFLDAELQKQFAKMGRTYGPIFKFNLGSKLYVVINTPEFAKQVVRDHDETFANHDLTVAASVITYGGKDLVFSNYNSNWRKLRKIFVQEVLSNKNLKACSSLRRDEVRKTIKNVFSRIGTKVDISEISFSTEANVITRMVWDETSYKGANGMHLAAELQIVASEVANIMGQPNLSDFFPSLAWFDLQGVERNMKKQLKKLDQIFSRIIEDRVKSNAKKSQDGVGDEGKKDFLQILLDLMDQSDATSLTIAQVKALLIDIMIAGTETTTTLIEWAMANIMQNHKVIKKVREELAEVVGLNNIVEEFHLSELKYLDATIKETFRLYPVAPMLLPRSSSKDCVLGGYTIPKGCTVFLNVYSIHRDPQYWDNPLEFNPERFLTNDGIDKWDYNGNNLKFFPFGSGRRLCPGVQLAEKMQMFILASLLHSFDWKLPNGEEHDLSERFGITLKKRKPLIAIPSQRLPDVSLYM